MVQIQSEISDDYYLTSRVARPGGLGAGPHKD